MQISLSWLSTSLNSIQGVMSGSFFVRGESLRCQTIAMPPYPRGLCKGGRGWSMSTDVVIPSRLGRRKNRSCASKEKSQCSWIIRRDDWSARCTHGWCGHCQHLERWSLYYLLCVCMLFTKKKHCRLLISKGGEVMPLAWGWSGRSTTRCYRYSR